MKLKKTKKARKFRGSRTCGRGGKKARGSGNIGGVGMAGTGKKAGQKITFVKKFMHPYFGKQGFARGKGEKRKINVINISDITKNLQKHLKNGEVKLENYKILGSGEIKEKLEIKAMAFSKKAKEKIENAGGKAIVIGGD